MSRGIGAHRSITSYGLRPSEAMAKRLAASFVTLVFEATLRSFWRRKALSRFLRQAGVAESFLGTWSTDESKRDFLDRLFTELPDAQNGQAALLKMAQDLAQQDSFPDLSGWEESERMVKEARDAVLAVRRALLRLDDQTSNEEAKRNAKERFRAGQEAVQKLSDDLSSLSDRLNSLANKLGTQQAGYEFQGWFYDLMDFFEVVNRRPYVANGRQIDGSITVSGTTYLVELKFTQQPAAAPDVDTLTKKVSSKADNTMGIMVSMSGYSSTAVGEASGPKTALLLLDSQHIYMALSGTTTFPEIVDRVRRHASQTGESFLAPANFEC
jgi:hypothetical protein